MENTLTGTFPPGDAHKPETNAAKPATTEKRDVKNTWKFLGSTTALLVALGAVVDQGTDLTGKIKNMFDMFRPATSEWTEDQPVIIEPNEYVDVLTIEMCDSTQESGATLHMALLLEKISNKDMTAFVLKKQGKDCRVETGHVLMNPDDFAKYIEHSRKADFKLSYSRAHLHSLDILVKGALER